MSGFLHRIAAGAVRPQPSAHPFVESIYPNARGIDSAGPMIQSETAVAQVAAQASVPERLSEVADSQSHRQGRNARAIEPPIATEAFEALLPRQESEPIAQSMQSRISAERPEMGLVSSSLLREATGLPDALEYEPMVEERPAGTEMLVGNKLPQVHALGENSLSLGLEHERKQPAPIPSSARSESSRGDDIQIHIGRIEVVAVPQSEPRPAAAPARKGLSLDEYLNRRNGRVG